MPRIVIKNFFEKTLEIQDLEKTLLHHLHTNRIDWMHACGGKGRCTTCKVVILDGANHGNDLTLAEQRYRKQNALKSHERLACQLVINGDITISVPDEYKLQHIHYSS
jgi:2Fe-2S ferredoxin